MLKLLSACLLLSTFLVSALHGAEVIKISPEDSVVALSRADDDQPWKLNEYVCLVRNDKITACGQVIRIGKKGVLVALTAEKRKLNEHDQVLVVKSKRAITSQSDVMTVLDYRVYAEYNHRSALTAGVNFYSPIIHFETGFTRKFTTGIMLNYMMNSAGLGSIQGYGGYGTLSYYSRGPFDGLWLQGGVGFQALTATLNGQQENFATIAGLGTIGWKVLQDSGFNIGIGAGAQYFLNTTTRAFNLGFNGFLPTVVFEMGLCF